MLDVLLLLAVTGRLLEGLDDHGRGGGNNGNGSLTVLDGELDRHAETFLQRLLALVPRGILSLYEATYPVTGSLGDIFADLLGRETERTNLGGEGSLSTDFTTSGPQVDDLDLIGVELGSYTIITLVAAIAVKHAER